VPSSYQTLLQLRTFSPSVAQEKKELKPFGRAPENVQWLQSSLVSRDQPSQSSILLRHLNLRRSASFRLFLTIFCGSEDVQKLTNSVLMLVVLIFHAISFLHLDLVVVEAFPLWKSSETLAIACVTCGRPVVEAFHDG